MNRDNPLIYLDNNATTLIDVRVVERMTELMAMRLANPSSQHAAGRRARGVLETAREQILSSCNARTQGMKSDRLLITSGGTESNNLALLGLAAARPGAVIVSAIEHPSILAAAEHLALHGRTVHYVPCSSTGVIDVEFVKLLLLEIDSPIACVSIMLANNETGVMQPVNEIVGLCRPLGIPVHCDAVQVLGKLPLDFEGLDIDAMTITSHKLHGPLGIGGLILKHDIAIVPNHFGGFQQLGLRPGTEMPALAGGFAFAIELACGELEQRTARMQSLRDALESRLLSLVPSVQIIGRSALRLPHTSCISLLGLDRQAVQLALDRQGIACSTGSACASGSSQPSHVLQAMNLPPKVVNGTIRMSVSHENTAEEIEAAVAAMVDVANRLAKKAW